MNEPTIEAEVVTPTQAVATRAPTGLPTIADMEQSFALAVRQRKLLSEYITSQLVPGKHFYQQGNQKPSLTKEGAEIILLPHNLCPDYEQTGGPAAPPEDGRPYQITIKCTLRIKGQPNSFVGSGIGSAGSDKGYWNKGNWEYQPRQKDRFLCHNATLKMAQKSAMIAATINSTAASEFFTQDMDDAPPSDAGKTHAPAAKTEPAKKPEPAKVPPDQWRTTFVNRIGPLKGKAIEFMTELGWILPGVEGLEDVPDNYIPDDPKDLVAFMNCLQQYIDDGTLVAPYESGPLGPEQPKDRPAPEAKKPEPKQNVPRGTKDDEAWRSVVVPVPRKGMKRADYLKNPDTIGSLYDLRHGDDDESAAARQRLWGFVNHYEPKGWTKNDGTEMPPSKEDIAFRKALDDFADWFERNHPDEKL